MRRSRPLAVCRHAPGGRAPLDRPPSSRRRRALDVRPVRLYELLPWWERAGCWMRLIAVSTIKGFADDNANARPALENWVSIVKVANWNSMDEVVETVRTASPINAERVVFNVGGNNYRIICSIYFPHRVVYVKWIGTHAEYDRVDAATVSIF